MRNINFLISKTLVCLALIFTISKHAIAQCPSFDFCMDPPYYEELYNRFAIDVYIDNASSIGVSGMDLSIDYTNTAWIIDEFNTEASAFAGIGNVNANFTFTSGEIEVKGFQAPLSTPQTFATSNHQFMFTIYFTATARSCSDFTFDDTRLIIPVPPSSFMFCDGGIGVDCEIDNYCIAGFDFAGVIESPVIDCDNGTNGGIPDVPVGVSEVLSLGSIFSCNDDTDTYGEWECEVVAGLDYVVTPAYNLDHDCGLTSLDIDILHDHLVGTDCLDYLWQWIAGDCNQNGILSTLDVADIQAAIIDDPIDWVSWQFVPAATYNLMTIPTCPDNDDNNVPPYDPYIEVEDVDQDELSLDFVGVKMGDMNATCTDCTDPFTNEEKIVVRSAPTEVQIHSDNNAFSISFAENLSSLEVLFLAFECDEEPLINNTKFLNTTNLVTRYHDGIFYLSYVSFETAGESFLKGESFISFIGNPDQIRQAGNSTQNEIIYDNNLSSIQLKSKNNKTDLIFPNPTTGDVRIELMDFTLGQNNLLIYNLDGRLVVTQPLDQQLSKITLNLPPGLYFCEIASRGRTTNGKLIIQ